MGVRAFNPDACALEVSTDRFSVSTAVELYQLATTWGPGGVR